MGSPSQFWILIAIFVAAPALAATEEAAPTASHLHLKNQDFYHGELVDSDQANTLRWRSYLSDQPFDLPLARVNAIYCRGGEPSLQQASHCLELVGGDIFYGDLVSLSPEKISLQTELFGEVSAPLDRVMRLFRCQEGRGMIFSGPSGLVKWKLSQETDPWQVDGGQLLVEGAGGIEQTFDLPPQICLEISLVIGDEASFLLALGDLFSLETFGNDLALTRETSEAADIAALQKLPAGESRLQLHAYIDTIQGKITVCSITGKILGSVHVPVKSPIDKAPLVIKNFDGRLRIEQILIRVWNGILPIDAPRGSALVHLNNGESRPADQLRFIPESAQLELTDKNKAIDTLVWDNVAAISFPTAAQNSAASLRANLLNGARLSGDVLSVQSGALQLQVDNVNAALSIPLSQIDSLVGLIDGPSPASNETPLLQSDGVHSHGELVETPVDGDLNRLHWRPAGSLSVVELRPDLSARIRLQAALPTKTASDNVKSQPSRGLTATDRFRLAFGFAPANSRKISEANGGEVLTLHNGDSFVCRLKTIDEENVTFLSDLVEVKSVPRRLVQAWHTSIATKLDDLADDKRNRLLTLPRRQRDDPPTHMIESTQGDFLRGRLIEMNEESIVMEVRLEEKTIDRDLVRRIVWLAEETADDDSSRNEALSNSSESPLVQAVHLDGFRLTFVPQGVVEGMLNGQCASLGACHIQLGDVYQLLLGEQIGETAAELAEVWRLKDASDPLFAQEDGSPGGGSAGNSSSLVGQPAPDFTLDLLDGDEKFTLTQQVGSVVVLDFWATWCGPCIQAMPQIDGVVKEFEKDDVKLIGVNMQEDRQSIKSLLERIKVSPTVALDIDGATAEKYQVTAIPQTVIIDRQGKVANLFVGGGPQFAAQLREAIQKVVDAPAEADAVEAKEVEAAPTTGP